MKKYWIDILALAVSIIALISSTVTFYYQFLYQKDSLLVSVMFMGKWVNGMECQPIMINKGTEATVVNRIGFAGMTVGKIFPPDEGIGPIIIKPGEAVSFRMVDTTGWKYFKQLRVPFQIGLAFSYVNQKGESDLYLYPVGEYKDSFFVRGSPVSETKYIDLFNQ